MVDLTIILPTKNSEKNIKFFLDSLKFQDYQNFFLFVADSESKDNTIEIIKSYNFNLKIISKKDRNAEEGINNCLKEIRTKYFGILMSDDVLGEKNYISQLIYTLKNGADIALPNSGNIINNQFLKNDQNDEFKRLTYHNVSPDIGWFARKNVINEGLFTEKYKLATAYHFLLRLYKKKYNLKRNRNIYYYFRVGGNSFENAILAYYEQTKISKQFGANKFLVYTIFIINFFKYVIKYKLLKFYFKV